jgi:microcystin-dependent protein
MSVRVGDEIVAGGQGDMYTKAQVDALIANAIAQTTEKPGMIKPFAGTTVPTGYLLCDGSAVSRTTYANLFSAIGTTYGSGDGSTTFNLPMQSIIVTGTTANIYGTVADVDAGGNRTAWTNMCLTNNTYYPGASAPTWLGLKNLRTSTLISGWDASLKSATGSKVKVCIKY